MSVGIYEKQPLIENFLDFREFLIQYYTWRKAQGRFSYQLWANELGLTSKGYLRLLIAGKRPLHLGLIERLSETIKLNKKQKDYFTYLVEFNQAKSLEMREFYFLKIQKMRTLDRNWISDTYQYLSDEWCPRVHTLLAQDGIAKTPEHIAKSLGLNTGKTHKIFNQLLELGYIEKAENNQWRAKEKINSVPDQLQDLAVQSFHKKSLEKAVKSIDKKPESRHYNATYFVVDESQLDEIREQINNFSKNLLQRFGKCSIRPENKYKLYQININAIPMSEQLIHSEIDSECVKGSQNLGEKEIMETIQ